MPIIRADLAENVIFLKRSMRPASRHRERAALQPKTLLCSVTRRHAHQVVAGVKAMA